MQKYIHLHGEFEGHVIQFTGEKKKMKCLVTSVQLQWWHPIAPCNILLSHTARVDTIHEQGLSVTEEAADYVTPGKNVSQGKHRFCFCIWYYSLIWDYSGLYVNEWVLCWTGCLSFIIYPYIIHRATECKQNTLCLSEKNKQVAWLL